MPWAEYCWMKTTLSVYWSRTKEQL